jgi:hypothetical protein
MLGMAAQGEGRRRGSEERGRKAHLVARRSAATTHQNPTEGKRRWREVEEREREVAARERKNERERGGACMGGGVPGACLDRVGVHHATGRAGP